MNLMEQLQAEMRSTPSVQAQMPEIGSARLPNVIAGIETALKTLWTSDPNKLATSLENVPGIKIERPKDGNPFALVGGKAYSLNKPGVSGADLAPLATALLTNIGIGKLIRPLGLGMLATETVAGAGTGAVMAAGEGVARSRVPDPVDVVKEAAIGGAGGLAGSVIAGQLGARLVQAGRMLDANGRLTRTAREALIQHFAMPGTNRAIVTRMVDEIDPATLQEANRLLGGKAATPDTLRRALATVDRRITGVPLTKGETTGNIETLRKEMLGRTAEGPSAQIFEEFEASARRPAIELATETAAARAGPRATMYPPGPEYTTGEAIQSGVRKAATAAEARTDAAYDLYRQAATGAGIVLPTATAKPALDSAIQNSLRNFAEINDALAPNTAAVLRRFNSDLSQKFTTPEQLEGLRRIINRSWKAAANNPTDRAALLQIRDAFDNWMINEVSSQPGGAGIMQTLQRARATARDEFTRFQAGEKDLKGKVIEKIVDGMITPEQIVNDMLGGGSKFTSSGAESFARLRLAVGSDAPEVLDDVKYAAVRRILLGNANQAARGIGPQAIISNIENALSGDGSRYINRVFGSRVVRDLRALQRQLQRTLPPQVTTNAPRSGYIVRNERRQFRQQALGGLVGAVAGALGLADPLMGATAGGVGGLLGGAIVPMVSRRLGAGAAERAIRGYGPSIPTLRQATQTALSKLPGAGIPSVAAVSPLGRGLLDFEPEER